MGIVSPERQRASGWVEWLSQPVGGSPGHWPSSGFSLAEDIQLFYVAGAIQARRSELMAFLESWSWRLRVEGSGGLEIVLMAPGL